MKNTFILFLVLTISQAWGAAYVPNKGKGMAILGVNFYEAKKEFDQSRKSSSFGNNGKFSKQELYYYLTYSLKDDLALIASGPIYNSLQFKNDFDKSEFNGSSDQFLAGRYFFRKDQDGASALQLGVTLPLYSRSANPAPGNRQNDLELRYLHDHFQFKGMAFISWEVAYRFRNSSPSDQLRADLNVGKSFDQFLGMIHLNYIQGLRNDSSQNSSTNPNTAKDFDLMKLGASVAYKYSGDDAIQLGYLKDIWGRNTGNGHGLFLAWWKGF